MAADRCRNGLVIRENHASQRYPSAVRRGSIAARATFGILRTLVGADSDPLKRWRIGRTEQNKRAPAHKTQVIRLTIRFTDPVHGWCRKVRNDQRKSPRCRGVIGPLPNGDIRFPKMTNAPRSSTVPVSPQRVTESNRKIESTDPRVSGATDGESPTVVGG